MASMSYCMFENTSLELQQVVRAMNEADSWEDLDLNEYESRAKEYLFDLCQEYIDAYTHLSDINHVS